MRRITKATVTKQQQKFQSLSLDTNHNKRKRMDEGVEFISPQTPLKKKCKTPRQIHPIVICSQDEEDKVVAYEIVNDDEETYPALSLIHEENEQIGRVDQPVNEEMLLHDLHETVPGEEYIPLSQPQSEAFGNFGTQRNLTYAQADLFPSEEAYQSPTTPPQTQMENAFFYDSPIQSRFPKPQTRNTPLDITINIRFDDDVDVNNFAVRLRSANGTQVQGITKTHKHTLSFAPRRYLQPHLTYSVELVNRWSDVTSTWEFSTQDIGPVNVFVHDGAQTKRITIHREGFTCLSELLAKASQKLDYEVTAVYFDEKCCCPLDDDDILTLDDNITLYVR